MKKKGCPIKDLNPLGIQSIDWGRKLGLQKGRYWPEELSLNGAGSTQRPVATGPGWGRSRSELSS